MCCLLVLSKLDLAVRRYSTSIFDNDNTGRRIPMNEQPTYDFEQSDLIPARAQAIYDAWMSTDGHTAMTGATAEVDPSVGGTVSAWDGYIWGRTVALEPGTRIVQSWRTSDFAETDADSQIEVTLEPVEGGTTVRLRHSGVPADQLGYENGGWQDNYFDPMKAYSSSF
jgi:activator of HSP90 ATPase